MASMLSAPRALLHLALIAVAGLGVTFAARSRPQRHTADTRQIQSTSQLRLLVVMDEPPTPSRFPSAANPPHRFSDTWSRSVRPCCAHRMFRRASSPERSILCAY